MGLKIILKLSERVSYATANTTYESTKQMANDNGYRKIRSKYMRMVYNECTVQSLCAWCVRRDMEIECVTKNHRRHVQVVSLMGTYLHAVGTPVVTGGCCALWH